MSVCSKCGTPTLEELIEVCAPMARLVRSENGWLAGKDSPHPLITLGSTPTEAVANLWLALQEVAKK